MDWTTSLFLLHIVTLNIMFPQELLLPFEQAINAIPEMSSMSRVGVEALLTSGRTLKQGRAMELGKLGQEYLKEVAICEMDKVTLEALGLNEGDPVYVETMHGSVIVTSKLDRRAEPGIVFIPCGPYANAVIGSDTEGTGMPGFKGIIAKLFAAKGETVPDVKDLLKQMVEGE